MQDRTQLNQVSSKKTFKCGGKKAVIVRTFDEGTLDPPYDHCLVAGIKKYPS